MLFNWRKRAIFAMAAGGLITGLIAGPAGAAHAAMASPVARAGGHPPGWCPPILYIGARGSGDIGPGTPGWTSYPVVNQNDPGGFGATVNSAFNRLFDDETRDGDFLQNEAYSVDYAANSVWYLPLEANLYFSNLQLGVNWTMNLLTSTAAACPNEQIVLMGYSQGAMVMHRVIHDLDGTSSGQKILARLDAAILIADGDQVRNDNEIDFGSASSSAYGVGHLFPAISHSTGTPFPRNLASRIIRVCNSHDPVCDATFLHEADFSVHTSYAGSTALYQAADYAAARILRLNGPAAG